MKTFENMKYSDAQVLEMAALEDGQSIEVGGLYGRMKFAETEASRRSLAKFVEFSRRRLGLTLESLAEKVEVDLGELLSIETSEPVMHRSQTLHRLATFLNVNPNLLLQLAGLLPVQSQQFEQAALHFAARTESVKPQEQDALNKFCEEVFAVEA